MLYYYVACIKSRRSLFAVLKVLFWTHVEALVLAKGSLASVQPYSTIKGEWLALVCCTA